MRAIKFAPAAGAIALAMLGLTASAFATEPTGLINNPAVQHTVIEQAGPEMPRADTANVVELPGGKLLVVYHKYEPGKHGGQDKGRCRIWMRSSTDSGRTWLEPRMLVDIAAGDMNVQAPALLRLPSGELVMVCLRAHGTGSSSSMCLFHSNDDGKTFREERPIWEQSAGQWLQGGANALVRLQSGRILLPFHGGSGNQWKQKNSVGLFVSDDKGHTWRKTPAEIKLPLRGAMEASVAELPDRTLVMSLRTQLGGPYLCRSRDGGETWSEPEPSGLESGESCTCLRTIPGTGTLLLLWNRSQFIPKGHHHFGERTPLSAAVSSDAGKTWQFVGDLATGPKDEYTNLGCMFTSDGKAIITYMFCTPAWTREGLSQRAMIVDNSWFKAAKTAPHFTGPWDMHLLGKTPPTTWGKKAGVLQEVYYAGEPLDGKPTRVFAYLGRPAEGKGPFPAMVLVHGGHGKAYPEWAEMWAKRGYVALAMDLYGRGPDGERLPDGGPDWSNTTIFTRIKEGDVRRIWNYHAVADVVRGCSLLASLPEVDARRFGITGISWGGYLTCIIAGIDDRLRAAAPVHGCGFLHENSAWLKCFANLGPEWTARWVEQFDPSRYLPGVRCPILFVNGTNDGAYPLDSYQKSYQLAPGPHPLTIRVRMPHGQEPGSAHVEIKIFMDSVLRSGDPLPRIAAMETVDGRASARFEAKVEVVKGELHYTHDTGTWNKRKWETLDAVLEGGRVLARLPEKRPIVYYLSITDARGALVSAPHAILP